jgi:hypothetical protein
MGGPRGGFGGPGFAPRGGFGGGFGGPGMQQGGRSQIFVSNVRLYLHHTPETQKLTNITAAIQRWLAGPEGPFPPRWFRHPR